MSKLTDLSDTDTYGWVVINRKQVHAIQALWDAAERVDAAESFPDMSLEALHIAVESLRDLLGGDHADSR